MCLVISPTKVYTKANWKEFLYVDQKNNPQQNVVECNIIWEYKEMRNLKVEHHFNSNSDISF